MKQYIIRHVIMISEKQAYSLSVLKKYNVNVSDFIRQSIKEKIKRDWKFIKERNDKSRVPF